jgi:hypothetical protein
MSLNQNKGLNWSKFITLGKIPEQEQIEIIKPTQEELNMIQKIGYPFLYGNELI